ncbi:hypothetical protein HFN89_06050 [Rhizobium laguerreae]|nr:hypothetical protein [Rhizobium laguerreae]
MTGRRGFIEVPLPHGFTTKTLLTQAAKESEYAKVSGRYRGPVPWLDRDFLALYDGIGAIATIIIANHDERCVYRVSSANYRPLAKDAQEAVSAYLIALDYRLDGVFNRALEKTVLGADGKFYDLSDLPDELHVRGDMYFHVHESPVKLPRRKLVVDGDLYLVDKHVETFPSELVRVSGNLELRKTNIVEIPAHTKVGGSFSPSADMTELPVGLSVGDILSIQYTKINKVRSGIRCRRLFMDEWQLGGLSLGLDPRTELTFWQSNGEGTVSTSIGRYRLLRLLGFSGK